LSHAVILLAHGSRDPAWRAPMEAVARQIALLSPVTPALCAYLELSEPTLAQAGATLVGNGAQNIRIVPMLLGVGKHAREDIPRLVAELKIRHPQVAFELAPAVGESAVLVDLLARIALGRG
jgi:sirohydrochlorin cobaltochelatase